MKKTQKAALSILLVLALLTALPLTAMAEAPDYNEPGQEISVEKGETLTTNEGHVVTNAGTITTNQVVAGSPNPRVNAGYIENNTGTVTKNVNGGYIENNQKGAVVEINHGSGTVVVTDENGDTVFEGDAPKTVEAVSTVKNNYGTVTENYGLVGQLQYGSPSDDTAGNYGTVKYNQAGGAVVNREGGIVENNSSTQGSGAFYGVLNYGGTVKSNSGAVYNDRGEVEVNELDGVVSNESASPEAADGPKVTTNYGEVIYSDPNKPNTTGSPYYGVHFENDQGEKVYLGQYKGARYSGDSAEEVTIEKLQANCKDYKIIGIKKVQDYNRETKQFSEHNEGAVLNDDETTDAATITSFKISAPTKLQLLWKKIVSVVKPAATTASSGGGGGAEVVELSAKKRYIGLGSVIFINEKGYKVVEIKDDAYVVASFDALSDEDVKDLDALFAKLFTAEQQKQIKNIGQLLDAEDVLAVFGKPGNHPVFEISKALVE